MDRAKGESASKTQNREPGTSGAGGRRGKRNARKGQAAMEYIMTYGWALVALVAVIGAILATGAFNPSYLISEECTLQPDLGCTAHLLYKDGAGDYTLMFRVSNGLGYDILLGDVLVTTSSGDEYTAYTSDLSGDLLEQGTSAVITMKLDGLEKSRGEIERMKVSVSYVSCAPEVNYECDSSGPEHTVSGRIVARIEQKD